MGMANKKSLNITEHSSSECLITLEALQAAANGIHKHPGARQSGIRIGSCNSQRAPREHSGHSKPPMEFVVHA
jgi:hypothetical protein